MLQKNGIVLEGGAFRSVFSAGVLDYFLEEDFHIPNIITLSAGAYAALNYVSKQKGRIIKTNIEPLEKGSYVGIKTFLKTGSLFDMDLLFNKFPNELVPFDYDTFFASDQRLLMSASNCLTGEAVYYDTFENRERLMDICRASNSLPFIAPIVKIDNTPMLDGGMIDAIPIEKAVEEGLEKIIVVFTRNKEYRKKNKKLYMYFLNIVYHKYPKFVEIVRRRAERYNHALEVVERLEAENKAYIIRPEMIPVRNKETNPQKLMDFYEHGYGMAKEKFEEIKAFLNG